MEETFEVVQQSIRNLHCDIFSKYQEFKLYLRGVFESDGVMGFQEIENKLEKYYAVKRTDDVEIELKNYDGVAAAFQKMIHMQTSINMKFFQLRRICKDADDQNKFDALLDEHFKKQLDLQDDVAEFVASQIATSGEILKELEDILGAMRQLEVAVTLASSAQDDEDGAKNPTSKSNDEKADDKNSSTSTPTIKSNDEKKNEVKALLEFMWNPKVLMALNLFNPEVFMSVFDDEANKCVADGAVNDQKDRNETNPVIAQTSHEFSQDIRQLMVSSKLLVDLIKADAVEANDDGDNETMKEK